MGPAAIQEEREARSLRSSIDCAALHLRGFGPTALRLLRHHADRL